MAKLKKLLVGALSMCMAVSMAACGNTGNGDNSNGGNSTTGGSESKWDGKKTDFTLQIFTGGYGADMWKYVIQAFEADHPEYNVVQHGKRKHEGRLERRQSPRFRIFGRYFGKTGMA